MVSVWLIFTLLLFVAEPLILHRRAHKCFPAMSEY